MENEKKEWPAERTQKKIEELREWIEANGHEPDVNSKNIREKLMAVSLQTLKEKGLWI